MDGKNQPNSEKKKTKTSMPYKNKCIKLKPTPEPYSGLCSYEMTWDRLVKNMAWLNRQTEYQEQPMINQCINKIRKNIGTLLLLSCTLHLHIAWMRTSSTKFNKSCTRTNQNSNRRPETYAVNVIMLPEEDFFNF